MGENPPVRYATARDGTRVAYVKFPGQSPPFLPSYTPGSPSLLMRLSWPDGDYLQRVRNFGRERSTIWFDPRGTGLSGPIRESLTIENLADDVEAVVNEIGEPVDAMGVGRGCHALLVLAERSPGCVRSLFLCKPPLRYSWQHEPINRPGWEADYRGHLRDIFLTYGVPLPAATSIAMTWEHAVPQASFASYLQAAQGYDLAPHAAKIRQPVWVTGHHSDPGDASKLASILPDATVSIAGPEAPSAVFGAWTREDWDRNLGARLGDAPRPKAPLSVDSAALGLSERELEVLCLLAAGRSNGQIAEALTLSVATVATHVRHILEKTGSANRTQAALWARDHGLP